MATENTDPKTPLIFQIGILSVAILIGLRFALVSYFNINMSEEYLAKVGTKPAVELQGLKEEEQKLLKSGAMPIERAMTTVATRPRGEMGAIVPGASEDMAAMQGWGLMPKPLPAAAPAGSTPSTPSAAPMGSAPSANPMAALDGGSPASGGGKPAMVGDAGPGFVPPTAAHSGPSNVPSPRSSAPGVTPSASAPMHQP